ncbi:receptor-type tyrosine-protein phosphatase N2 isoform X2 [Eurosta solidaginis]|uniref:receptor-type tyrosine-protein phosphatase N2 isoform X2 n=1 Tax=Eurosta solidaginis TaxID=178769 RepID=UPI003530C2EF
MTICNKLIANLAIMRQQLLDGGPIMMACNVQPQRQQQQKQQNEQQWGQTEQHISLHQQCFKQLKRPQQQQQQSHPKHQKKQKEAQEQQQQQLKQRQQPLAVGVQQISVQCQRLPQQQLKLMKEQQQQKMEITSSWCSYLLAKLKLLHLPTTANHTLLLLQLLVLLAVSATALGEGNVGCHFVRTLCLQGSEVCFDDNIFGKCIPTTGVDVEDIEKTPLTEEQSNALATMLEELQGAGLGWDHPYVQCRIQGALYSLQKRTQLPPNLCANLSPVPTGIDSAGAMAFVRFQQPEVDYIDERYYYPPLKKQQQSMGNSLNTILHQLRIQDRQLRHDPMELEHFGKLDVQDPSLAAPNVMDAFLENERARIQREQLERAMEIEAAQANAARNRLELYHMLAASEPDPQPYQRNPSSAIEKLEQVVEREREAAAKVQPPPPPQPPLQLAHPQLPQLPILVPDELSNDSSDLYFPDHFASFKRTSSKQAAVAKPVQRSFFRELAAEQGLRQEPTLRRDLDENEIDETDLTLLPAYKRNSADDYADESERKQKAFEDSLIRNSLTPFEEEAMLSSNTYARNAQKPRPVFTEGGLVYVPEDEEEVRKAKAREIFDSMFGFTRHERLDVKKPGPMIGPPPNAVESTDNQNKTIGAKEVLPAHIKGSKKSSKKKKVLKEHSDEDHAPHTVDTEYAHVFVKNPIDSWNDGVRIMTELANILHMQGYFTYLTVQPHEVSFRVNSNNPEHKTAADIARAINESRGVKNNILRRLGVTVLHAGVGDKIRDETDGVSAARIELAEQGPDVTHIMAYMFAGAGAAAVIVIFVTLILIKRHDKKRDKLGGLQSGVAGAESCSKDYQDLCRARMAGKGSASETVASGRITSLTKENDRPPSSRSSTSSWSEEPAMTNMDISTGHMVLSYMEDHLRNKGRLQREWEALCRYEAEPSARDAAHQPQCINLNRPGAPLPYDHSRVVLNHLANAEGLDYINASTITDHDPRAPAYVAAQGPLPTTLAHFWQMIWEQGAVVIVSLCRLQENGEIACARYWPEEGAEVYHIYEVHLVSEHIWCDDYLVRSFYLKNLRTSETRTVTQFHFLSWPQGGVPAQAKALLDFRRKVNKSYRGRSCPIVVHGSAGAGRTGAYILLDLVLGRMNKGAREIDIAATLEHLRDQRAGLVATRQQFEFVLMAVAEEVHAILKALPANQSNEKRELEGVAREQTTTGTLKEEEAGSEEVADIATTSKTAKEAAGKTITQAGGESSAKGKNEKHKEGEKERDKSSKAEVKESKAAAGVTAAATSAVTATPTKSASVKK